MQVIAEYYHYSNRASDVIAPSLGVEGSHNSNLGFIQGAYTLGDFVPYLRYEQAGIDTADPYFASQEYGRPYKAGFVGLRYNIEPRAAIKLEVSRWHEDGVPDEGGGWLSSTNYSRLEAQFAVRF